MCLKGPGGGGFAAAISEGDPSGAKATKPPAQPHWQISMGSAPGDGLMTSLIVRRSWFPGANILSSSSSATLRTLWSSASVNALDTMSTMVLVPDFACRMSSNVHKPCSRKLGAKYRNWYAAKKVATSSSSGIGGPCMISTTGALPARNSCPSSKATDRRHRTASHVPLALPTSSRKYWYDSGSKDMRACWLDKPASSMHIVTSEPPASVPKSSPDLRLMCMNLPAKRPLMHLTR
mmetsp:Transcript_126751/g.354917  ORF Transcript_126751/g.354917 Transcript_126751/m.354917 type:complete len:235 (-) Transcript_126751:435-1139(-)